MFPSSRNIADLSPRLRAMYVRFDAAMKKEGIDYIVTCTYRNNDDQKEAYAQGRTNAKGPIITWAQPGQSPHNCVDAFGKPLSDAFDIVIMNHGKPDWDSTNPRWKIAGKIGKSVGLEWGGYWSKKPDYPHFQQPESE